MHAETRDVGNNWAGKATMQSSRLASTILLLMFASAQVREDREALAIVKHATPFGARCWRMCCIHAKLALLAGGKPNSHSRATAVACLQLSALNGGSAR